MYAQVARHRTYKQRGENLSLYICYGAVVMYDYISTPLVIPNTFPRHFAPGHNGTYGIFEGRTTWVSFGLEPLLAWSLITRPVVASQSLITRFFNLSVRYCGCARSGMVENIAECHYSTVHAYVISFTTV
jgi:hypothetical protein